MRFGHVRTPEGARLFVEVDGRRLAADELVDDAPATLDELISGEAERWLEDIASAVERADGAAELDGPLGPAMTAPPSIIAIGLNYLDHCREFGTEPPARPIVFAKLRSSLAADGDAVRWHREITSEVDWEAELGVVIGATCRDVSVDDAPEAIFGYTVVNDFTARDIQSEEQQWIRAKSLDGFCPLGPVVVTRDEIPDPQALSISSRVNGKPMQDSTTAEMIFSVADLVSYLSRSFTLNRGDVIATGTPVGVGRFRTPPVFLADGDVVEAEVEGIGVLRNECREL